MSMQAKALALAEMGFNVFPLIPYGKKPVSKGWNHKACRDITTIKIWWPPESVNNIGIHCTGLCVIDVDVKKENGFVEFLRLPSAPTRVSKTTTGGAHVIYRLPAGTRIKNQVGIRPGIDIRTDGGFIVAPGSVLNGIEYQWANDLPIADIPLDLLALLQPGQAVAASDFGSVPLNPRPDAVPAGSRDADVYRICCSWRAQNLTWEQAGKKLQDLWPKIEQPPDDPFTWAEACAKLEQAWKHPAGTASDQLAEQIAPTLAVAPVTETMDLTSMLKRFILIEKGARVGDLVTKQVHTSDEFKSIMKPYKERIEDRRVEISALWLASKARQTVADTIFYPDTRKKIITCEGYRYFNTYKEGSLPTVVCDQAIIQNFLKHLQFLTTTKVAYELLLDWLAFSVQYPWRRMTWAYMILTPNYGVGKDPLFKMMQRILGKGNCSRIDEKMLDSTKNSFNGYMSEKTMLLLDEIHNASYLDLKSFITDDSKSINHKYGQMRMEDLFCSVLMFSNHIDAVRIPEGDRRIYTAVCYEERRQELGYYTELFDSINHSDTVPAHFMAFLRARDVSKFGWNRTPPMTAAKRTMITTSMPYAQRVIESMFEDELGPCMFDIITPSLALAYAREMAESKDNHRITMSDITTYLGPHYTRYPLPADQYRLPCAPASGASELNTRIPRCVCIRNHERWQQAPASAIKLEYLRAHKATIQTTMTKEKIIETTELKEIQA